jgi:hypothetical protein
LTQKSGIISTPDNTLEPSEATGPISSALLSTLLALAGGAVNEKDTFRGHKLRSIGIRSFEESVGGGAGSGVQILFGVEAGSPAETLDYLSQVRLACWPQTGLVPTELTQPVLHLETPGLAEFAWAKPPGAYWLSIEMPGQRPVAFSVAVLPDRLALIVFTSRAGGEINFYQYLPALAPIDPPDPRRFEARFPVLQRSESIQRAYLSGRLEEPDENAQLLLYAKWVEPVAGALGGYILLRLNPHQLLSIATNNMKNHFSGLSDSHVLAGAYAETRVHPVAERVEKAYRRALETGLPIFSEGLERLIKALDRWSLDLPQATRARRLWEKHVPGLLWTAVPVEDLE